MVSHDYKTIETHSYMEVTRDVIEVGQFRAHNAPKNDSDFFRGSISLREETLRL